MSNSIGIYEPFETVTDILHDIYLGHIDESDIIDFIVYLENEDTDSWLFFGEFLNIIESLNKHSINSSDFTNLTNIGLNKLGELLYFDIGFGDYYANTSKFGLEVFKLNNEKDIFKQLKINNWDLIGHGANGEAFDIGNNKILKITKDNSEAYNSCLLFETPDKPTNLINIHYVGELLIEDIETKYIIIQDRVEIDKNIRTKYNLINKHFEEFKPWHI